MAKTVIGLFDRFGEAQSAVEDLMRYGVRREDISLVARDEHGDLTREREVGASGTAEGAGAGAVGGSLVGGALGLLVGTGLLVIPGLGPVLAAGPLAAGIGTIAAAAGATAIGAGLGAAAGGLLGGLMGAGVPEEEAHAYLEGVRRGGTLLSVHAADTEADDVREILLRNGAVDIGRRSGEWRSAGWNGRYDSPVTDIGGSPVQAGNADMDMTMRGDAYPDAGARMDTTGSIPRGDAYSIHGDTGRAGDVAGERAEGEYRFRDGEDLNRADRKVVDTSYTDVDRTGDRVKGAGFESGHAHPRDHAPEASDEFLAQGERSFRTPEDTRTGAGLGDTGALGGAGASPYRADGRNAMDRRGQTGDLESGGERTSPQYGGADEMGGAMGNMRAGSGSSQPGRAASGDLDHGRRVRIYDSGPRASSAADQSELPAHGDFARGMREETPSTAEPDFARGMHEGGRTHGEDHPDAPHHGDFARGMRDDEGSGVAPDFARGQRSFELYDRDFIEHHRAMMGAGGQPYDYYKPGYQFGYDMANNPSYSHDSWDAAERDARTSWERDNRNDWEEFKQTIRYGWEKARGRA
jgi:hypothetical protein